MADKRKVAETILKTALEVVMNQRQDTHGDAEDSFAVIGQYWTTYLASRKAQVVTAYDVVQMMVLLKTARASMGNAQHADHYVDTAGYSALAAMLAQPKDT